MRCLFLFPLHRDNSRERSVKRLIAIEGISPFDIKRDLAFFGKAYARLTLEFGRETNTFSKIVLYYTMA